MTLELVKFIGKVTMLGEFITFYERVNQIGPLIAKDPYDDPILGKGLNLLK
jgi:hypothetical protein